MSSSSAYPYAGDEYEAEELYERSRKILREKALSTSILEIGSKNE